MRTPIRTLLTLFTLGFISITTGACGNPNNQKITQLRMELETQRELLQETRNDLSTLTAQLEPLTTILPSLGLHDSPTPQDIPLVIPVDIQIDADQNWVLYGIVVNKAELQTAMNDITSLGSEPEITIFTSVDSEYSHTTHLVDTLKSMGVEKIAFQTIEKLHKVTISRTTVSAIVAGPDSSLRGARIVPSIKNGISNGFKLYAIRPSSTYAKLGFKNGDTIHSINGALLVSIDTALTIYKNISSSSTFTFAITRRGQPFTLKIEVDESK